MFKKFVSYYGPHKKLFFLDLLAAIILSLVDLLFPMLSRSIINDHIPNSDISMIVKFGIVLTLLFVLRAGCMYFMNYWGHVMGARMERDMRRDLFKHYLTLPFKFYDENKTGKLMSRLVNDLHEISEVAHHVPEDAFISILLLVGSLGFLMTINVSLTLILIVMVSMLLVFATIRRKAMQEAFREQREQTAIINAQVENSISGIRLCQSYANEEFEYDRFTNVNQNHYKSKKTAFKAMGQFVSGTGFLSDMMNLMIVVVGGIYTINGWINIGDLIAFLLYASFFMRPVRNIVMMIQQLQSGITGFERFHSILNLESEIQNSENPVAIDHLDGDIHFEGVTFAYDGDNHILENLNLDIASGKHIALVGPSGVGKSTIISLIPRFYDVTQGAIKIGGHDIREIRIEKLRKSIGIVQQDVFMFNGSIKDNILYGDPDAADEAVEEAAKNAFIHDFIMTLPQGYDTMVGERGVKLSGGQKQRISIARVFLKNPPIVILDEATSSLDNESELYVQQALDRLAVGKTTVTVAHRLSTIMNADEILVLEGNAIVERGRHGELIESGGIYKKLYTAQFKGYMPDEIDELLEKTNIN
ncbi:MULTISPECIES: ABC transporter ATP-binding protein [unclassified Fusibacter]|uniref:ABC transporter ATP-binding protein n=1 Tax=unclassified Fusibacter TaxID=2624464 RepID=UPI001010C3AB|nr:MULTISPECIES: ABC transporter ATP-binding protein [unclassified Fusibacter]MCK8058284.1 ABC transporter ATP-binding protein/permease [Fusibacter sp. A2]NPE20867.1 ABC transporter ATP-binding protein [Fusibacter sp. A1]RXV63071.1 ABC transporter ATP-binding protein [Fusibacter sp. A1]